MAGTTGETTGGMTGGVTGGTTRSMTGGVARGTTGDMTRKTGGMMRRVMRRMVRGMTMGGMTRRRTGGLAGGTTGCVVAENLSAGSHKLDPGPGEACHLPPGFPWKLSKSSLPILYSYDVSSLLAYSLTCYSWYLVAIPHLHHALITGAWPLCLDNKSLTPGPLQYSHKFALLPLVKTFTGDRPLVIVLGHTTRHIPLVYFPPTLRDLQRVGCPEPRAEAATTQTPSLQITRHRRLAIIFIRHPSGYYSKIPRLLN